MTREIERKFLPVNDRWTDRIEKTTYIKQGYVDMGVARARVRVTRRADGTQEAFIYLKNKQLNDREEFELKVPIDPVLDELIAKCCVLSAEKKRERSDLTIADPTQAQVVTESTRQYDIKKECTLRMRLKTDAATHITVGELTIKSPRDSSKSVIDRTEIEYAVSEELARALFAHICSASVDKTRYVIRHDDPNIEWTVDHFSEERHENLFLIEAEHKSAGDISAINFPDFVQALDGEIVEVTNTEGFTSSKLAKMQKLTPLIKMMMGDPVPESSVK